VTLRALQLALFVIALGLALPAQAAEIVIWHAWRDVEETSLKEVAAEWSKRTGHTVIVNATPYDAYNKKVEAAIPQNNGPDLLIAPHDKLGKWTTMGLVTPVGIPMTGHLPSTISALEYEGTAWGLPLAYKSVMLFYDPEKISTPPTTTDELLSMARKHTGDGSYGLVYEASTAYSHAAWMHGFGASPYDADGSVHLDSDAHVASLRFAHQLTVVDRVVPKRTSYSLMTALYNDGKAAFVISGPWFVGGLERPIAAAPLPTVSSTGLPAQPFLGVDGVFLANHANEPEVAKEFMAFLAGPQGARIRQETGKQAVSWAAITSQDPILTALASQAQTAIAMPADPNVNMVFEAQNWALRRVNRGLISPEAGGAEAQAYYNNITRPPPEPANPVPYIILALFTLLGGAAFSFYPMLDPYERKRVWDHRWDYAWVLPSAFAMVLLVVVPFMTGAAVSLFAHDAGEYTFVGFKNFFDILLSRDWPITSPMSFYYTLVVTVLWTFTNLILHVGIGVALALILREPWIRMRGMWRALLIIPWAVPNYITALIWKGMFNAQYGAVNALLGVFAGANVEIDWFGQFATSFCANLITNTWLGFPFMMVVTLGALQSIPRELEEAAEVDGASYFFRFRHVVWPLLKPALLPAIILGSVWTFNMFNIIYLVSAGEPDGGTEILISEAYKWAFQRNNRYGYAAAYAVLIFFVLLAYSRGANRLVGKAVI